RPAPPPITPLTLHDALPILQPHAQVDDRAVREPAHLRPDPAARHVHHRLVECGERLGPAAGHLQATADAERAQDCRVQVSRLLRDRKSTRLNSSHEWTSYAV